MNDKKNKILEKIEEYDSIIISRHIRPDGDALGATLGLKQLIIDSYANKNVYVINDDLSNNLSFFGAEDKQLSEEQYKRSLLIVIDTATADRISNSKFEFAKEVIRIDHHIEVCQYGDISWVEPSRSSACEMIASFYYQFKDKLILSSKAATLIYTGMVTDSGRFRYSVTTGETLRLASILLDCGIDTERLYAQLYLSDAEELKFKSTVLQQLKLTENGVAYLYISQQLQKNFKINDEQASNTVSYIDCIKGSIIWLAFIENKDGSVRVRLRSRFVPINLLAEKYNGGGHAHASGATVYNEAEMQKMLRDADDLIKEYKKSNTDWL